MLSMAIGSGMPVFPHKACSAPEQVVLSSRFVAVQSLTFVRNTRAACDEVLLRSDIHMYAVKTIMFKLNILVVLVVGKIIVIVKSISCRSHTVVHFLAI